LAFTKLRRFSWWGSDSGAAGVFIVVDLTTAGLLALFVVAVVPLVPTEMMLVGMGVAVAQHGSSLLPVIAVGTLGCVLSDQSLYVAGRVSGKLLARLRRRHAADAVMGWLDERGREHPVTGLVICRWLPLGGSAGALLAGSLRWPPRTFAQASVLGVVLWVSYAAVLGYVGGSLVEQPAVSLLVSLGVAALLSLAAGAAFRRGHETTA
jgi:membrane protein DedA with SNARE-associated domain